MNQDILPADKELRKRFIIFLGLIVIVFVISILSMKSYLDQTAQLTRGNPDLAVKKVLFLLKWWLGLGSFPILSLAVYQILLARRVLKSGQFPPPGMKVVRDTKIRTGGQAKKAAITLIVLSSVVMAITLFLVYWPYAFEKKLIKKSSNAEMNLPGKQRGVTALEKKGDETKMKGLRIAMLSIVSLGLIFSLAIAASNVEKGKALFKDPKFGGGTAGMSCNSCHPDGKGLEKAANMKGLEKQVNACIKNALKGKGIDLKSAEMADIVAYIKSLKGKTPAAGTPGK